MAKVFSRRNLLVIWMVLLAAATLVANQNWYKVHYVFGAQPKTLESTGVAAWPLVSGALSLWGIGLLATLLLRGWLRTAIVAMVSLVTVPALLSLSGAFRQALPPTLAGQVERATGIAGGVAGSANEAILSVTSSPLAEVFLLVGIANFVVLISVAIASIGWARTRSPDKYQRASQQNKQDSEDGIAESKTESELVTEVPGNSDSIALWDSQR